MQADFIEEEEAMPALPINAHEISNRRQSGWRAARRARAYEAA
jgi:hypothetical protein